MTQKYSFFVVSLCCLLSLVAITPNLFAAEKFDPLTFEQGTEGPWSDIEATTIVAPKVSNASIKVDGTVTPAEYGNSQGKYVSPDETAYPNAFPDDYSWDSPADSSFTFYVAHDDTYFYIGVDVKDDVVNSNEEPSSFWNDDAIEMIIDGDNFDFDQNESALINAVDEAVYGVPNVNLRAGHTYFNYEGTPWKEASSAGYAAATDWVWGPDNEMYSVGKEVAGGWQIEIRLAKSMFESAELGTKLQDNYKLGFNIGMDDDDLKGPNGSGERSQDLEIQYFWSARKRAVDPFAELVWNEENMLALGYTPQDVWSGKYKEYFSDESAISAGHEGYLKFGSAGDIVFANQAAPVMGWDLY